MSAIAAGTSHDLAIISKALAHCIHFVALGLYSLAQLFDFRGRSLSFRLNLRRGLSLLIFKRVALGLRSVAQLLNFGSRVLARGLGFCAGFMRLFLKLVAQRLHHVFQLSDLDCCLSLHFLQAFACKGISLFQRLAHTGNGLMQLPDLGERIG